jgi:hypothetical protein
MFKRTALFAFAAALVVGLATLASSAADARPNGGGGHSQGGRGVVGGGHGMGRHPGIVRHPGHGHGRHIPGLNRHIHLRRHIHVGHHRIGCWRHPWLCRPIVRNHCWHHPWHWHCRRPVHVVGGYYPVAAAPAVVRPVAASCTCLRKTYLPNGAVLFQDVCTNESAVNPPAQAAEAPPQGS